MKQRKNKNKNWAFQASYSAFKYLSKHCNFATFFEFDPAVVHDGMPQSILHWGTKIAYYNVGKGSYKARHKEHMGGSTEIAEANGY
jgi:hypothetical protein